SDRRQGSAPGRCQALRPVRDERRVQDRRRAGDHEGPPRRGPAQRRLHDGDRQDRGREPESINPPDPDGKILRALNNPIHATGGLTVLQGSLAPEGAVVKSAGFDADVFEGTARVFDQEKPAMDAVLNGELKKGDVVVIRYEGPKGGPGMR